MSLIRSFKYAIEGISRCVLYERNMRIHFVIALYVLYFSTYYEFSKIEYAVILILFAVVFGAEMINTAIEEFVDLESPGFSLKAKAAKDIAAGAVLVCAVFAVIIGIMLFWDKAVFLEIVSDHISNPLRLVGLCLSVVLAVLFVKFGIYKKRDDMEEKQWKR